VLLYLQKFNHKFFNFNFIKQLLFISVSIGFNHHLQILGSLVFAVSLSVYYLLLSIPITNFINNLERALITELLWTQSRRYGGLLGGYPPRKSSQPPKLMNQWNFVNFQNV